MLFWSCWIHFCWCGLIDVVLVRVLERGEVMICVRCLERRLHMMKLRGEGKDIEEGGRLKERDGGRSWYSGSGCLTRGNVYVCIWHVFLQLF